MHCSFSKQTFHNLKKVPGNLVYLYPLLLLLLCFPRYLLADSRTIDLVEEASWPPFTLETHGSATKGLSYDLMAAIFTPLGIPYNIKLLPQKRMLIALQQELADGATVISKNASREKYLAFSELLISKRGLVYFLKRDKSHFEWNDYSDFTGFKIAITLGHNYGEEFEDAINKYTLNVHRVSSVEQSFRMLKLGRVDFVLANEWSALYLLNTDEFNDLFRAAERAYFEKGYHLGLVKSSVFVKDFPRINAQISRIRNDGTLNKILGKYFDRKQH